MSGDDIEGFIFPSKIRAIIDCMTVTPRKRARLETAVMAPLAGGEAEKF